MSADPVAKVLADVARRNEINCTGPGEVACRGRKGWHSWTEHRQHIAEEQADALREAGLIPEATTRVEWGVVGGSWNSSDRRVKGPLTTDLGGYPSRYTEALARHDTYGQGRPEDLRRRTVTTYADHVTEWEAVD